MSHARVYPLYVQKAEKKGRTQAEVDEVIRWLTGYDDAGLQRQIAQEVDLETFFAQALAFNPNSARIVGVVCGVRVEEVEDPLMQKIRYLDKLVDELGKGRVMGKVLRGVVVIPDTFCFWHLFRFNKYYWGWKYEKRVV